MPEETSGQRNPVYVRRRVSNGEALVEWARELGVSNVIPARELHLTVVYSRTPVCPTDLALSLAPIDVEARNAKPFHIKGHLAIPVEHPRIREDHARHLAVGATHDYGDGIFRPHVTLKYDATPEEFRLVERSQGFSGTIEFEPEEMEPLVSGWRPGA